MEKREIQKLKNARRMKEESDEENRENHFPH